jgi:cytoskeletal protein RodZ
MRTENHPVRRSSAVGAFGEKLRKQREQRGIALDAISNTTKISTRMLRAIEEEHFDQLPGGVFNKGFVRAYARQVGLNEEEAVTDYLTALRESQIAAQTVPPNFRVQPSKPATEPDRRNPEPVHRNSSGYEALKNDLPKPDFVKNDLLKNDLHKTDVLKNGLRKDDIQRHDAGRDNGSAESRRNENSKPAPRRSADRRREDRRNRARGTEHQQAPGHQPDPHPHSFSSEPVVSPAEDSAAQVPWGKLAAVLLLLTVALALWSLHRRSQATRAAQTAEKTAPSPLPSAASSTTPLQVPVQPAASSTPLTAGKALTTGTLVTSAAPNFSTAPTLADATAPKPSPAPPPKSSPSNPAAGSPDSDGNLPVAQSAAHAPAAKTPPTFSLLIRATETSWVTVTADGQPLLKETLIAPAQTSVRATREIVVHTGNAAGISFLLDGKEIPLSGSEGEGESKTYTFDNTGLKSPDH